MFIDLNYLLSIGFREFIQKRKEN